MTQKGFAPIIFIFGIILISAGIVGGSFYYKANLQHQGQSFQESVTKSPQPKIDTIQSQDPQKVVEDFFKAVQLKDRIKAKSFLSPDANKAAFKSTFDDLNTTSSLYNQNFDFQIIEKQMDSTETKAFVKVNIIVAGQILPTTLTLEKDSSNNWLITDSETVVTSQPAVGFEKQYPDQTEAKRVLLVVTGPVDLYLSSPEGTYAGIDPKTGAYVSSIKDAFYNPSPNLKSLSITNLVGNWELQVVGNNTGKYKLGTELVSTTNHQTQMIEGDTSKGLVSKYLLHYPNEAGKPLEVTLIK